MLDYINLNTKADYNKILNHFKITNRLVEKMDEYKNLADLVAELSEKGAVEVEQIMPLVNTILVQKFEYSSQSLRLERKVGLDELMKFNDLLNSWNGLDVVFVYFHPTLGTTLINPKNASHWDNVLEFSNKELLVVYVQSVTDEFLDKEKDAICDIQALINEGVDDSFKGKYSYKEVPPEPKQPVVSKPIAPTIERQVKQPSNDFSPKTDERNLREDLVGTPTPVKIGAPKKMTPKYSCQVTNELFHNGNVEAWKNIIQSYEHTYPELTVLVYHDGQKVKNLNSLFKWGKVKHGDVILFAVVGDQFKGISKLQKYLFEGASNRFEVFLKKEPGVPLRLF